MRTRLIISITALSLLAVGCPSFPIDDVEVVERPVNVLSCLVHWTTDVPATSRVEFGVDAPDRFFVEDDALVTDHEVLVIGMRPDTGYQLQAVSVDEAGKELLSEPASFETGTPPFEWLLTELTVLDEAQMQPGWTLTNVGSGSSSRPPIAVMFDAGGVPVWYHQVSDGTGRVDVDTSWTDQETVLVGGSLPPASRPVELDLAGEVLWEGPEQPEGADVMSPGMLHHALEKLDNGHYLALMFDIGGGGSTDVVVELDAEGNQVWSWSSSDHYTGNEPYPQANTVLGFPDEGLVYFNSRMLSEFLQIDRATGEVLWTFGEGGDFAADPDHPEPWFTGNHGTKVLPDNRVLMLDNGSEQRGYSRVIEYALDPVAMTSEVAWEYPGELADDPWFDVALGDSDRLANGNTIAAAARAREEGDETHIFEVTADGEKVWELYLRAEDEDEYAACYAVQRIPVLVGML